MRLRQTPLQGTIKPIDFAHDLGVHFVLGAKPLGSRARIRRRWVYQLVEFWTWPPKHVRHCHGPFVFVDEMPVVEVLPHLVLKEPAQFPVKQRLLWIVTQPSVSQQL